MLFEKNQKRFYIHLFLARNLSYKYAILEIYLIMFLIILLKNVKILNEPNICSN